MVQKIYNYIRQNEIIKPRDKVIAGVSGGADSVCLFLVLEELRHEIGFELEVIHVEHGIRGEDSERDADFTRHLCLRYNIPCKVLHIDVNKYAREKGLGVEEAARILRYDVFAKYAKETGAKVAVAHHQEDNAETILFQMTRGSGLHGVTGIKARRYDDQGVCYIRPLLCVRRAEIESFLEERNQEYCIDATNEDTDYDRNRIRHFILPELEKINQRAIEHINQTARRLSVVEDYISLQIENAVSNILCVDKGKYIIDIEKLSELHEAVRDECILEIIGMAAGRKKDIGLVHVEQIIELCSCQSGKKVSLPYSIMAYREYDKIILTEIKEQETLDGKEYVVSYEQLENTRKSGKEYTIYISDDSVNISFRVFEFDGDLNKIPQKPYTKWLCYDKIKSDFLIRRRESGDYFISDFHGHKKKLKEFFINEKIPASVRDDIWLLANGKEIVVIFGARISENYKVTADTKEVLEVRYSGGNSDGFF